MTCWTMRCTRLSYEAQCGDWAAEEENANEQGG